MTRKQHLQKLPLQKRLQAMENIRKSGFPSGFLNREDDSNFILMGLFSFYESKQGADYWFEIDKKYFW